MTIECKHLTLENTEDIIALASDVNPDIAASDLNARLQDMFSYSNYRCFGLFLDSVLIGITSGWLTTRFYSGKQLEVDNVIINKAFRSQGYGTVLLDYVENWSKEAGCLSVELNTYVVNSPSHKFYFNQGYHILGYHFQKALNA